jgi:hypothetical protein
MEQAKCATGRGKEETRNKTPAGKRPSTAACYIESDQKKKQSQGFEFGGTCKEKKHGGKVRVWYENLQGEKEWREVRV